MKNQWTALLGVGSMIGVLAGGAAATERTPAGVPDPLKAPEGQVVALLAHGTGVQIYECQPGKEDPAQFAWNLVAPEADLFSKSGKKLGKHYAGPTWEAGDGSKVVGELVARDNGPDATAIPWLLLRAKSTSGKGIFGAVVSIQRLHTKGGKAPAGGCDSTQTGKQTRVPYEADYYYYAAKS